MTEEMQAEIQTSRCKSCDAEIIWAHMIRKDGTPGKMPFDKEPNEKGFYCLSRGADGKIHAAYMKKGEPFPLGGKPRTSHFYTCPNAEQHRKAKP
jgi:hypothetical protein